VLKKNPELVDEFVDRAAALVAEGGRGGGGGMGAPGGANQAVALAGVSLMLTICALDAAAIPRYRAHVPALCNMLRGLLQVRAHRRVLVVALAAGAVLVAARAAAAWLGRPRAALTCWCHARPLHRLLHTHTHTHARRTPVVHHRAGSIPSTTWAASPTPTCRSRCCSC
jgi:hypothetical protein